MHTEFCPCRSFHKQSLTAVTVGSGACLTSHTTSRSACCKHQPRNPYRGHPTSPRPELSAQQTQSPHVHSLFTHNLSVPRRSRAPRNSPRIAEAAYGARNVTAAHSSAARRGSRPAPHDGAAARTAERLQPSRAPSGTTERSGPAARPGTAPVTPPREVGGGRRRLQTFPAVEMLQARRPPARPLRTEPAGRPARPAGPTAAAPLCPASRTAASEHGTYLLPAAPRRTASRSSAPAGARRGLGARLARERHREGRAEGNAARALTLSRPSSRVALETARGAKRGRRRRRFKGGARACSPRVTWAPPNQWATANGGSRSTTARGR